MFYYLIASIFLYTERTIFFYYFIFYNFKKIENDDGYFLLLEYLIRYNILTLEIFSYKLYCIINYYYIIFFIIITKNNGNKHIFHNFIFIKFLYNWIYNIFINIKIYHDNDTYHVTKIVFINTMLYYVTNRVTMHSF